MNKLFYLTLLIFAISTNGFSQSNALDMDGGNDNVVVSNASSRISSNTSMSMTFWVYPKNTNPSFPNFDGFAGFRNNSTADFYILQLSSTTVEARFRNSTGTNYDIAQSGLSLNTWQHYVLTYNGSTLSLYRNGILSKSISASGNITAASETFYLGLLKFGTTNFNMKGKIDDVSLWSKALSANEVKCIYEYGIDTSATSLELYYNCNQGKAGSNNSGLDTLNDEMGNINGSLTGFSLSGSSSNWVKGVNTFTNIDGNICDGDSLLFASKYISQAGKYHNYIPLTNGCDSIIELTLLVHSSDSNTVKHRICLGDSIEFNGQYLKNEGTYVHTFNSQYGCDSTSTKIIDVDTVNLEIVKSNVLFSKAINATYQWYNCDGDSIIPGETNFSFAFTEHASYAVIVTQNNCTDTSECLYTALGIDDIEIGSIHIYPNPSLGELNINLGQSYKQVRITLTDTQGKIVNQWSLENIDKTSIHIPETKGMYLLQISTNDVNQTFKIIKE